MNDEVQKQMNDAKDRMHKSVVHLEAEFSKLRAGKAAPEMVDHLKVDYYGSDMPMSQVAGISTPDARTIIIQPWEKAMLSPIEKAILQANLGFTPTNNGEHIRINLPPMSEERRKNLVKQIKTDGEQAKVNIRNIRRDANEHLKKLKKNISEDEMKATETTLQKFTDEFIKQVDKMIEKKEKDVMSM